MELSGDLRKLRVRLAGTGLVSYTLPLGEAGLELNPLIGRPIRLRYGGEIHCIACGRKTAKSYSQGHCYPCSQRLAACDLCIVRPEKCHYAAGTCREPQWGFDHCMQPHAVYLANTSGLKVGITRAGQIPTRWIDQGASAAVPILRAASRLIAGRLEVVFKAHVADRTDWRRMLRGEGEPLDLVAEGERLLNAAASELETLRAELGAEAFGPWPGAVATAIHYPVECHPHKVTALNLDKTPELASTLHGVKGQYLILEAGVLNIRKYAGYGVSVSA